MQRQQAEAAIEARNNAAVPIGRAQDEVTTDDEDMGVGPDEMRSHFDAPDDDSYSTDDEVPHRQVCLHSIFLVT